MNTLFLTAGEQKVFEALPANLKEGWKIDAETTAFTDTSEEQLMRLKLMELRSPQFATFQEKTRSIKSPAELLALASSLNFSTIGNDDLTEIFFALGPVTISRVLTQLLRAARTDEDVDQIAALTIVRHVMFS